MKQTRYKLPKRMTPKALIDSLPACDCIAAKERHDNVIVAHEMMCCFLAAIVTISKAGYCTTCMRKEKVARGFDPYMGAFVEKQWCVRGHRQSMKWFRKPPASWRKAS